MPGLPACREIPDVGIGLVLFAGVGTHDGNGATRHRSKGQPTSPPMSSLDPVVSRELPIIRKIIEDETWLEAERRGCHVRPDDHVVRERVCEILLRVGQDLRDSLTDRSTA